MSYKFTLLHAENSEISSIARNVHLTLLQGKKHAGKKLCGMLKSTFQQPALQVKMKLLKNENTYHCIKLYKYYTRYYAKYKTFVPTRNTKPKMYYFYYLFELKANIVLAVMRTLQNLFLYNF